MAARTGLSQLSALLPTEGTFSPFSSLRHRVLQELEPSAHQHSHGGGEGRSVIFYYKRFLNDYKLSYWHSYFMWAWMDFQVALHVPKTRQI